MAKAGFWLRGAKGKLAGASIGKGSQGGTVIREIVSPKNPKTTAQMIQRIIWNTCIQAYVKFKALADHSFEGFSAGSPCQQEFMRLNARAIRQRVAAAIERGTDPNGIYDFIPVGSTELAANSYALSRGTLPVVNVRNDEADSISFFLDAAANTYAGVAEAYGLRRGDQITLVQVVRLHNGGDEMRYARVILDPINADGTQADWDSAFVADGAINLPSPRNTGTFTRVEYDATENAVSFSLASDLDAALGTAAIASRFVDNQWLRSNSDITFKQETIAYSLSEALAMTNAGVQTLNDLYLNNAGQGLVANFNEGGSSYAVGINSVSVNGTSVASTGTTAVAPNQNSSIVINVRNADENSQAAYRINSGNWVVASASVGSHTFTGVALSDGDSVQFAAGDSTTGAFIPSRTWGGTLSVHELHPEVTAATVNGVNILNASPEIPKVGNRATFAITITDFAGLTAPKIVRTYNNAATVGEEIPADASTRVITGAQFTYDPTWGATGTTSYYALASNNVVIQLIGAFTPVDAPTPQITALTSNGTSILNSSAAVTYSNEDGNPTIAATCANLSTLTSPKLVFAEADVAVGGTVNLTLATTIVEEATASMSFTPDMEENKTYHAYLTDGSTVVQKCGSITFADIFALTRLVDGNGTSYLNAEQLDEPSGNLSYTVAGLGSATNPAILETQQELSVGDTFTGYDNLTRLSSATGSFTPKGSTGDVIRIYLVTNVTGTGASTTGTVVQVCARYMGFL